MRRFLVSLGLGCVCLVAFADAASSTPKKPADNGTARRTVKDLAACVIRRSHDGAVDFIIARPQDEAYRKAAKIFTSECLDGGELRMPASLARGGLAEALLGIDFAGDRTIDFSSVAPLEHPTAKPPTGLNEKGKPLKPAALEKARKSFEEDEIVILLQKVAECTVRKSADGVRTVLATNIASKEETGALRALSPNIATCVDQGTSLSMLREPLRASLAVAYYELLMAKQGRRWQTQANSATSLNSGVANSGGWRQ